MTIAEMHIAFKLELDKSSALELPAFEPEEIDFWLNNAIREFVKSRYTGTDKGAGFETNLKRIEDLKSLIVEETISGANLTTGTIKPYSYIADLTSLVGDKWFTLGEEVLIQYHDIRTPFSHSTKRQGVTQCTVDTYRSHLDDPYSEHVLHYEEAKPLRLVYQDTIELVTDGNYEITAYYIRYLNQPAEVSITTPVSCDLPEHTHDEIVKLAVNMTLENIEQPRYKSYQNELNKVE
jgi:hypothetical protein